jgi:hypothetical protein
MREINKQPNNRGIINKYDFAIKMGDIYGEIIAKVY